MKYTDIINYINELDNLTKIDISIERDECDNLYVVKTKETFTFKEEEQADEKVDLVRKNIGFAGVDKKYKQGKMNKAGEQVKPETWVVVAKINQ